MSGNATRWYGNLWTGPSLCWRAHSDRDARSGAAGVLGGSGKKEFSALRCFFQTLHDVAGSIAGVHGCMATSSHPTDDDGHAGSRVRPTIDDELRNTEDLLRLWDSSRTAGMPVAAMGENWALHGKNFGLLLHKKIELVKNVGMIILL